MPFALRFRRRPILWMTLLAFGLSAAGCQDGPCTSDAQCDDGLFCNGIEWCSGTCHAGAPPCSPDDLPCGAECDEEQDACIARCCTNADCDDGIFCNGAEVCDTGTGACMPGTRPCGEEGEIGPCGPLCSEEANVCVDPCNADAECDDVIFCNGAETCDGCSCHDGAPPCENCSEETGCPAPE
jgi:hypothetical protein